MAKIKRALLSVSDKKGIVEFAKGLRSMGIEIISTGGTANLLRNNDIRAIEISTFADQPEMMEGRVKTLTPKIHGGILAIRDKKLHIREMKKHGIKPIDMVVVNLYPFLETILKKNVSMNEVIEQIDIGGPAMIRSAAKNFKHVAVVVQPQDYPAILKELQKNKGALPEETKRFLAYKAFKYTARYDATIGNYLHDRFYPKHFPDILNLTYDKVQQLRYGENPHQQATFYKNPTFRGVSVANAKQLQGKQLSFNNILDANDAFELVKDFKRPTAAVIKHTNPSGVATRDSIDKAFRAAYDADPMSAFGGIVALNRPCARNVAQMLLPIFIEVVIAPRFEKGALRILRKKGKLRLLETGTLEKYHYEFDYRRVVGGMLVQTRTFPEMVQKHFHVVTKRKPTPEEIKDMLFAWKVNKHVKSNSVVFVKDMTTVGIGAGQMSRVDSSMIAAKKAGRRAVGSVLSSDAFFPFRDGVDEAAKAGVKAIIQPGGSIRDKEVIEAADEHGMAMVFTGIRLFKH